MIGIRLSVAGPLACLLAAPAAAQLALPVSPAPQQDTPSARPSAAESVAIPPA